MKRWPLLTLVLVFELALFAVGVLIISWRTGSASPGLVSPSGLWRDLGSGVLASLPLLTGFLVIERIPLGPFRRLTHVMRDTVAPIFRNCSAFELAIVSLAAGIGEEVFFRGALQVGLATAFPGPAGSVFAVACVSALFGALHWITPTYALCAAAAGAYLGVILMVADSLCVPIVTHATYDFIALMILLQHDQKNGSSLGEEPSNDAQ